MKRLNTDMKILKKGMDGSSGSESKPKKKRCKICRKLRNIDLYKNIKSKICIECIDKKDRENFFTFGKYVINFD